MRQKEHKTDSERALLVEDYEACRKIMHYFLTNLDYEVELTDDGEEAVKMVQDKQYDLILSGIKNKGLSGDKVIPLIRRKNKSKNVGTPVIAWSGFVDKNNKEMFLEWGADWALEKVCDIDDLKIAIEKCCVLQRYEREFSYIRKVIENEWIDNGGQIGLLKELFNLNNNLLSILLDALESIMEYNQWKNLSCSTPKKLGISQVETENSNS
ncbi:MAG TPA: response regulator [Candidatus Aquirickettsiella sp.]|jgi:DNA-binding response OmpR family regulator